MVLEVYLPCAIDPLSFNWVLLVPQILKLSIINSLLIFVSIIVYVTNGSVMWYCFNWCAIYYLFLFKNYICHKLIKANIWPSSSGLMPESNKNYQSKTNVREWWPKTIVLLHATAVPSSLTTTLINGRARSLAQPLPCTSPLIFGQPI